MEPDVLFHKCVYHWFRNLAQLCGIDLFLDDFKPHPRTYMLVSALYVLLGSCIWTIYSYPFDEKLICASFLGLNCQGIVKFHSFLGMTKEMKDVIDFSFKIYKVNKNAGPNKTCLEKSVRLTVFIFKAGMVLLITTAILTCIKPCISYIFTGKLEPIIPSHLPGIDELEMTDYACLALFHIYILFVFVIGTAASDLGLNTIVIHAFAMSHLFRNAVNEFNVLINKDKRHIDSMAVRASLNNLIAMHNDFIKYTKLMKTIYNEMCLIQITMANVIMIVLLYVILMVDYFPAYFYMATAFFQVFEYSVLGTIVEIANDRIYDAVRNIIVIELPIIEQKKVILMTLIAQHPHHLTIGGFQPLNVKTFISAMKTTYTVGMLLVNTHL